MSRLEEHVCCITDDLPHRAHTLWGNLPFVGWSSLTPSLSSGNKLQMNCSGHSCHCGSIWQQRIQGCVPCRSCVRVFTCAWEFCILWCSVSGVKEADLGIGLGEPHSPQDPMGWVGGLESPLLDTAGVLSATTTRGGEALKGLKTRRSVFSPL